MTGHAKLLEDYSYRGTQTAQRGKDVQIASSELTFSGSREPLIVNSLICNSQYLIYRTVSGEVRHCGYAWTNGFVKLAVWDFS